MLPARLLAQEVVILRAKVVKDRYGTETLDWSAATQIAVRGSLQPRSATESEDGRSLQQTDAVLYTSPQVDLTGRDRVRAGGITYSVVGPPQVVTRRGVPHHLVADLRHVEG